jgi:hypothetical protein
MSRSVRAALFATWADTSRTAGAAARPRLILGGLLAANVAFAYGRLPG